MPIQVVSIGGHREDYPTQCAKVSQRALFQFLTDSGIFDIQCGSDNCVRGLSMRTEERQRSSPARTGRLRHTPAAHRKAASLPSVQDPHDPKRAQRVDRWIRLASNELALFSQPENKSALQISQRIWRTSSRKAQISYFIIYDLRPTYATCLSAEVLADEWWSNCFDRVTLTSSRNIADEISHET